MSDSNNSDEDVSASEASFIPSEEEDTDDDDYSDAVVVAAAAKKTKDAKMQSPIAPKASKASPKKSPMNNIKRKLSSNVTLVQDDDSSNVVAATSRHANKKTVAKKSLVGNDENDVKVGSSSSQSLSTPSKNTTASTPKKSSTKSRPRKGPGSIFQSDGYDIVLPSTAILEHVVPNPNEFSVLIQIDTSTVSNTGTKSNLGTAPSTLRMTSGSVIGRLELLSPPITTPGHHNHNNHRIKFDYHGTEYIGQIYPGPTAMILSLAQQQPPPPPQPEKLDHSGIDGTVISTSAVKMEIDNSDKAHAIAPSSTATASSCVLVVNHIVNEFCNMIPVAAATVSHDTTKTDDRGMQLPNTLVTGTTGSGNVDYFQYNDDIYDVNKTTTIAADNDDVDMGRRPTKKPKKKHFGSTTATANIGTTSRKVSSIVKSKPMKRK